METSRSCVLEIWLSTFLASLLAASYGSLFAAPEWQWIHWPITVSLIAVSVAAVALQLARKRLYVPEFLNSGSRLGLFFSALIIGVSLDYAITHESVGPRAFRVGVFVVFGVPLFGWLAVHLTSHFRASRDHGVGLPVALAAWALALLLLYLTATLEGGTA